MTRPAHPNDDIMLVLEEDSIANALGFIAAHEVALHGMLENSDERAWRDGTAMANRAMRSESTLVDVRQATNVLIEQDLRNGGCMRWW